MQLEDWLDDLCVRFIINLPSEDLSSVARICFQVEEAQWFYEDFIRPQDPTLPSMSLRSFCLRIFQHCPLLASFSVENHMRAFEEFLQYKTRVPVRGAILLNEAMDSTVLVKGWKKGANWSFPRGKINKDEDDLDCAIREVYEETGFDIRKAGLVPKGEVKFIQIAMREQQIRLYVFRNIPMDTVFQPKTRKEISKIEWYRLSDLPAFQKKGSNQVNNAAAAPSANKFYMVAPFLTPLKRWVLQQKKKDGARTTSQSHLQAQTLQEEPLTEDDIGGQREPTAGGPRSPPAIETIEGATLELQRLLKVQPPTQGLQMSPANATSSSNNKGDALMALLRQKTVEAPTPDPAPEQPLPPQHTQVPHTPLDHTYVNPPEPHSPHHHHPQHRLSAQNYQAPPPNFPLPHLANQPHHAQQFHYARPHVNITPQGQAYGRNPYMGQGPPPRKEPVLLHPQPLPPQVQQSRLVREILPTPNLPDMTNQKYSQGQYGPPGQFPPQNPAVLQQQPQPQAAKPAPQLTSHKMSLLNALKNDNRALGENIPPQNAGAPPTGYQAPQAQATSASWNYQPTSQAANPASQYLPQRAPQYAHSPLESTRSQVAPSPGSQASVSRQSQPNDAHRSSLLDMFKKTTPLLPTSSESTAKPAKVQAQPGFASQGSPLRGPPHGNEGVARPMGGNGGHGQPGAEANLPTRPIQILSRNAQQGSPRSQLDQMFANQQMHNQAAASINSAQTDSRNSGYRNLPSPRGSFMRGESGKGSPRFSLAAQAVQAAGYPYGQSPQQTPPVGPATSQYQQANPLQQRQNANPEQKQKLLSLFGTQDQVSPTGYTSDEKGKAKEGSIPDQIRPGSGVASLASAGGENVQGSAPTSRRDSGTPISPANRSFLLSYLESVSSNAR